MQSKVKPLDLANVIRDAFLAGAGMNTASKEIERIPDDILSRLNSYDPEHVPAFHRLSALHSEAMREKGAAPANPAQGVSEIERLIAMITPGNFHHQRNIGDAHGWCERLREALTAAIGAGGQAVAVKALPDDDDALAQMVEDSHAGSVSFANEPDQFHHLIEFTPPRLREFVLSLSNPPAQPEQPQHRLELALAFVARMCWRNDPPNANAPFTTEQRFEAIKYHPTVKHYGKPHIELAEREAGE